MTPLSVNTRILLLCSLALVSLWAVRFTSRQNQPQALGGPISPAKLAWLAYTIFVWFLLCPLLALTSAISSPLRLILGSFSLCMWGRGLLELYMLYISKNWRPPFGIAHDVVSLLLVLGMSYHYRTALTALTRTFDYWTLGLLGSVLLSLLLEVGYASAFHRVVAGQTTGTAGVWFATTTDVRFTRINRLTCLGNLLLYGFLSGFLGACFGLW